MLSWLTVTTLETTLLIGIVLLSRPLIRRVFGANVAYTLWLIPLIGVLLPARPPRPATPLEVIRLPGAEISQALNSAAETFGNAEWTAVGMAMACGRRYFSRGAARESRPIPREGSIHGRAVHGTLAHPRLARSLWDQPQRAFSRRRSPVRLS